METITTMFGVEMTQERFNQLLALASDEGDPETLTSDQRKKLRDLKLRRLKIASDDYKEHKALHTDPLTEEPLPGYKTWHEFRDEFLVDRELNYRRVSEKEADVTFDRIADESLSELDTTGAPSDVNQALDQVVADQNEADETDTTVSVVSTATPSTDAPVVTKRRGRPPGSGKKAAATETAPAAEAPAKRKSYYVPVAQRKAAAKKTTASKVKTKAKKPAKAKAVKKGGSTSERAQHVIEVYQGKGWSRKDIIEKLQAQIDGLGAAYASTLYQKYAK